MQGLIITDGGQELTAKMLAGTSTVRFTKLRLSDFDYSGVELRGLTAIENVKQESLVSGVERKDDTTVEVISAVDNSELTAGYYIRALGLFASDDEGGEVLYAVDVETENPNYMPAFNGGTVSAVTYKLETKVDISSQVSLEIDPAAAPTMEQVQGLTIAVRTHAESDILGDMGVHGIRYNQGELQIKNDAGEWVGGNAATVNGHTVNTDVPADAVFTDTVVDISGKMDKVEPTGSGSISINRKSNTIVGYRSVAMGTECEASAYYSVAIGDSNAAVNNWAISLGKSNTASGENSIAIGDTCEASGYDAIALGYQCNASGEGAFASGGRCNALGGYSHTEGFFCTANGYGAHAEGCGWDNEDANVSGQMQQYTKALANAAHAEGAGNYAEAVCSHAEGAFTRASGTASHAEGGYTHAAGNYSHSEGYASTASGLNSHAEGSITVASGIYSHAEGERTLAAAVNTHAGGYDTIAGGEGTHNQMAIGHHNRVLSEGSGTGSNTLGAAFIIGNGVTPEARSNAFRVDFNGYVYGNHYSSSGADYAEFIKPWFDGNPNNEDRVGYFVTIKNGGLCFAEEGDYIVGITSGNPSIVGNSDEDWLKRWERDEFNRIIMEDAEETIAETDIETGEITFVKTGKILKNAKFKSNPDYDPSQKYIERKNRPEWDYVGMIGVLPLRDDGSCVPGGFAKCGAGGIATAADEWECHKTFFVIERVSDNIVKVEMR